MSDFDNTQEYSLENDLRVLATRRKNREWLRGHSIDLAHQSRLKKKNLPLLYRLKETVLPVKPGESFGTEQENGKNRFLKRQDGTYFDREKYKKLYDASESARNEQWNTVYSATLPSSNALTAYATIRNDALTRLNALNMSPEEQNSTLLADLAYKRRVNKFLNRYNT